VAKIGDFFSLSECRDLLFHVKRTPAVRAGNPTFFATGSLQFLGFDIDDIMIQKYRAWFPSSEITIGRNRAVGSRPISKASRAPPARDDCDTTVREFDWPRPFDPIRMPTP